MSRRQSTAGRSRRGSRRTAQSVNELDLSASDDDDFMERPSRASTTRAAGGAEFMRVIRRAATGDRPDATLPMPATSTAARRRGNTAVRGNANAPVRRNESASARVRGDGPIFGGRQNQLVRRATGAQMVIAGAGRAYRTRRSNSNENAGAAMNDTIVIDDEEVSNEEGDDVEVSEDDEEEEDDYDLEDSFLNDESMIENPFGGFEDDDDDIVDSEDEGDLDVDVGGRGNQEETFSQEVEEFELMEERENAATRRAEERRRRKEDQEEKENKNVLRTDMFGACTVCAEDEVTDPVGCLHCANFIGCRKCATRWYRTSKGNDPQKIASCPLCRHQWMSSVPEVGDMLDLVKSA